MKFITPSWLFEHARTHNCQQEYVCEQAANSSMLRTGDTKPSHNWIVNSSSPNAPMGEDRKARVEEG
jgi:hypothetical protein